MDGLILFLIYSLFVYFFGIICSKKDFLINIPEIMNSDQGSQMTSADYINLLESKGIKISMDGRGRCFDNIFTERLWRNVKYEEVYLKEYQTPKEARQSLDQYFNG